MSKENLNKIINELWKQLKVIDVQDCETIEDYLNVIIGIMSLDKKYFPENNLSTTKVL